MFPYHDENKTQRTPLVTMTLIAVGEPQYALAARAWDAFREPTPDALSEIRNGDSLAMPYLSAAVTRFLQEYPWTVDGLSRSERRLLDERQWDCSEVSIPAHARG